MKTNFASGGVEAVLRRAIACNNAGQPTVGLRHAALHTGQRTRLNRMRAGEYREVHRAVDAALLSSTEAEVATGPLANPLPQTD